MHMFVAVPIYMLW